MSDIKNIEQHYSLEERLFLEKVRGFCQLVEDRYSPYLTDFLNPREIQIVKDLANYYNLKFFVSSTFSPLYEIELSFIFKIAPLCSNKLELVEKS